MISAFTLLHPSVFPGVSLAFCPFITVISCCHAATIVLRCMEIVGDRIYGRNGNELQV